MFEFQFKTTSSYPYFEEIKEATNAENSFVIKAIYSGHDIKYILGKVTQQNDFQEILPIVGHVQPTEIYKRTFTDHGWKEIVSAVFIITDKSGGLREICLTLNKYYSRVHFPSFFRILNSLNHFIDTFNDVEKLDVEKLNNYWNSKYPENILKSVPEIISKLDIKEFENSKYVPQKDNEFWSEIEVRNLPDEDYLNKKFFLVLSKEFRYADTTDFGWIFYTETESGWLASFDRREVENSSLKFDLKLKLSFELGKIINDGERLSHYFLKQTECR